MDNTTVGNTFTSIKFGTEDLNFSDGPGTIVSLNQTDYFKIWGKLHNRRTSVFDGNVKIGNRGSTTVDVAVLTLNSSGVYAPTCGVGLNHTRVVNYSGLYWCQNGGTWVRLGT